MRAQMRALESRTDDAPADALRLPPAPSPAAARTTKTRYETERAAAALLESLGGSPDADGPDASEASAATVGGTFDVSGIDFAAPPPPPPQAQDTEEHNNDSDNGLGDLLAELTSLPDLDVLEDTLCGAGTTATDENTPKEEAQEQGDATLEQALAELEGLAAARALLRDYGAAEDRNEAGLRRGKKEPALGAGGRRTYAMEDAHAAAYPLAGCADAAVFVVCDGFAGRECAAAAVAALPDALTNALEGVAGGVRALRDLAPLWPGVFAAADAALRAHEYVGCTCTAVLVWAYGGERYVQAANVGDSNVYLYRGHTAVMLSTEHKVTSAAERARIQAMGIEMTPGQTRINGVAVARALGTHFIKDERLGIVSTPSVSPAYRVQPDDRFLVIASDGLWDVISGQAACEMVRDLPDAAAMATRLLRHAVSCSKCVDNVTVVVVRL